MLLCSRHEVTCDTLQVKRKLCTDIPPTWMEGAGTKPGKQGSVGSGSLGFCPEDCSGNGQEATRIEMSTVSTV